MDWIIGKILDYIWYNQNVIVWRISLVLNILFIPMCINLFIKSSKYKKQLSQKADSNTSNSQIAHYQNLKSVIKNFYNLFESDLSNKLLKNSDIQELQRLENEIFNLKNESKYLFNKNIFKIEEKLNSLLSSCKKACQGIGTHYVVNEYFSELKTITEQIDKLFDEFLQKNR